MKKDIVLTEIKTNKKADKAVQSGIKYCSYTPRPVLTTWGNTSDNNPLEIYTPVTQFKAHHGSVYI